MQRFLGVDIGNSGLRVSELNVAQNSLGATTRVSWRHADNQALYLDLHEANGPKRFLPSDPAWLRELRTYLDSTADTIWFVSSVRRDALRVLSERLSDQNSTTSGVHSVRYVTFGDLPLAVNVESPERVGIDRLLAALAASRLTDAPELIAIQAGSAVTVDLVTQSKGDSMPCFEGGSIVPGVPMMLRLLGQAADQLPEIDADDLTEMPKLPGKNTEQAMLCGAASALVGGVCHLVQRFRDIYGKKMPVILSGGDGMRIAPYIPAPVIVESHLVQRGLLVLAREQVSDLGNA